MVFNSILYVYAFFFVIYSILMNAAFSAPLLVLCLFLLIFSLLRPVKHKITPWIRLLLVCSLHVLGQSNACLPIYLLCMAKDTYFEEHRLRAWNLSFAYAASYLLTAFSILSKDSSMLLWLLVILNLFHFLAVVLVSRSVFINVKQAEILKDEKNLLSTRDKLTGLYNYDECHRRLEELVGQDKPLLLVIIDCTNLKSMNTEKGFHAGNQILKQIADLLKISFSEALCLARYGGDEFAVALPLENRELTVIHLKRQLDSELPKLIGIQITYGIAMYPYDSLSKDDLILMAEHQLFMRKREMWIKREEHMLQSEKLRLVGEMASGMAHEIRNPLTTVKGFLQVSKANGYNIENWYSMIMDEINRMSELTAEFLQFSKPQAAQYRIHSLHECMLRVLSLTESEASRLGHQIHYHNLQKEVYIWMDPDKIVQLLLNLVKNAYEAMNDKGSVVLRLSRQEQHAILEIQDNGQGIAPDLLDQIFHPFYTTKESGTGLGLSICHKIVQDHQGTMEVESILGQGTKFIITFPLVSTADEQHNDIAVYI